MAGPEREASTWRAVAIILALAVVVLVPSLFTRDPWNPDEPRYAEIARAMVATGNYLVPHLNGEIYPDKPALFFWMTAGLMRLGVGNGSGRVVAAAFALGTLWLVYVLGRRLYGREVGLLAAAMTATTLLFAWMSKCGIPDPPLTFCVVAAICCGAMALDGAGRRPWTWWLGFYAAMGLGVLFKGPVALAVPALVMLAYGIARRREARKGGWWHLAGAALFLAVVAAGIVPSLVAGGEQYANEIVFGQTAVRFTRQASHAKPFYFYLATWPAYLLPWSLLLPLALVAGLKAARSEGERHTWLPVLWVVVVFVFFSIPTGKRERYILPVVPAVALLVARYVAGVAARGAPWPRWHKWLWRAALVVGVVVAVVVSGAALSPGTLAMRVSGDADVARELRGLMGPGRVAAALGFSIALVAAVFYAATLVRDHRTERRRAVLVLAAAIAFSLVADLVAVPVINRFKSGRDLIDEGRPYIEAADELCLYRDEFAGVYNLFAQRSRLPVLEDLDAALASPRRIAVIAREKHLRNAPPKTPYHQVAAERVGSKRMTLIINWDPAAATPRPR